MNARRKWLLGTALAAVLPRAGAAVDEWPNRPLRIVSSEAGGVPDIRARWLGERLARALGQPVIVENMPGAGGNIAAAAAARSAPDGYTLGVLHQGIVVYPFLHGHQGFDPLADLAPVTRFGLGSLLLAVRESEPIRSVLDLIALAKSKPGQLAYGSPGIGSPPHLASELFKRATGIDVLHVPFKGGGSLATALLAGQITWSMDGLTAQIPHVKSGRLRALGVTGAERAPILPDVPTIAEAGVPGYEFVGWTGFAVPAATPRPIVERLNSEITKIAATAEARDWFLRFGSAPATQTPEAFGDFVRGESARMGKLIQDAGIKAE